MSTAFFADAKSSGGNKYVIGITTEDCSRYRIKPIIASDINAAELAAVQFAFSTYGESIEVYTDSQYVISLVENNEVNFPSFVRKCSRLNNPANMLLRVM